MIEYMYYEDPDGSSLFTTRQNADKSMRAGLLSENSKLVISFALDVRNSWGQAKKRLYELTGIDLGHFED